MTEDQRKRLKSLYVEACEVASSERSAFLIQKCGGDDQLRREVESLLEYGEKADLDAFLDLSKIAEPNGGSNTRVTKSLEGQRIGAYQLAERIGAGGMDI